uniref:exodeoxyribonuclease III n=1 Tax=Leptobrachium leishanense TaxID=445787 RepID=A0A8C5P8S7_9ANUR
KGLNIPEKRHSALRDFRSCHADVVLIQETHFPHDGAPRLSSQKFPLGFFSNSTAGKVCGTAILLSREIPFTVTGTRLDTDGRYTFVKGTIGDQLYTFASIYLPNRKQHRTLRSILTILADFQEGVLVLGGDLNLPLDARLDTSRGVSSVPHTVLRQARTTLHAHRLVDCWRTLHPTTRDYTHFSSPHHSYSRIDCIFLPFGHIRLLESATIGPLTWSDHNPVIVTLHSPLVRPRERLWRLNETLITDPLIKEEVTQLLHNYFRENVTPHSTPQIIWEAHKAVVRGCLIQRGSQKKKAYAVTLDSLLQRIHDLEQAHKQHIDDVRYASLLELRTELHSLLNVKAQKAFLATRRLYHEHGNKCGRLLARALRSHRQKLYISKLRTPQGSHVTLPRDMIALLQDHFYHLYNLPQE